MALKLSTCAVIFGLALLCDTALAQSRPDTQSYPVRPIRIIVANTPGSQMDNVTRMLGQGLTEAWGQQIVVDNRAGAGGIIGHEIAAKAAPDGYTLLFTSSAGVVVTPLLNKISYDMARDFTPVSLVLTSIQLLASHPSLAVTNVGEFLALARSRPGQLNCGSTGSNSTNHVACEMLNVLGHVNIVHVPFKGTVPQIMGLVGGEAHVGVASIPTMMTQAKAGKVRVLGQGGTTRSRLLPDLPTVAETLPGYQTVTWYALYAPRATPPAIVAKLNAEIVKILSAPTLAQRLANEGLDPAPGTPAELTTYARAETERFTKIIKLAGMKPAQ